MSKMYDNWWLEGPHGDQDMEDSHQTGWQNVIKIIDKVDIIDKNILDFGCNQGGFLRVLYDKLPYNTACGVDLAKKAITVAQNRVSNYPIEYYCTDNVVSLNRKFNTAISTSVLYLIEDLAEHFASIWEVLETDGVYYTSFADQTKNPSNHFMNEKINKFGATSSQDHTLDEVVDALVKQGFSVELRKEYRETSYHVTNYREFYLSVDDYILACENSFLIKATKLGGK